MSTNVLLSAQRHLASLHIEGYCIGLFDVDGSFIDGTDTFCNSVLGPGEDKASLIGLSYSQVLDLAVHENAQAFENHQLRRKWQAGKLDAFAQADGVQRIFRAVNGEWDLLSYHRFDNKFVIVCRSGTIFRSHQPTEAASDGVPLKVLIAIAQRTSNAVVITDPMGLTTWVNPAFTHTTGYSLEQMLRKAPGSMLQGPQSDPAVISLMRERLRASKGFRVEIVNYRADGRPFWNDIEVIPVLDEAGDLDGFVSVQIDISPVKEHAQALERARNEALATQKLKSEFLAVMSHEIRTPLNGVMGLLDLALVNQNPDELRRHVATARDLASSLIQIVNDTLDLSRMEAGKVPLENELFDPEVLIAAAANAVSAEAHRKGVQLKVSCPLALPAELRGAASRVKQILVNLLGNAIKFTDVGKVSLLACWSQQSNGGLTFRISDTGSGIAGHELEKIFEPYEQVGGQLQVRNKGVGLGLSIVHKLVHWLNGTIAVRSQLGSGTEFEVFLPFSISQLSADAAAAHLEHAQVVVSERLAREEPDLAGWLECAKARVLCETSEFDASTAPRNTIFMLEADEEELADQLCSLSLKVVTVGSQFGSAPTLKPRGASAISFLPRPLLPKVVLNHLLPLVLPVSALKDHRQKWESSLFGRADLAEHRFLLLVEDDPVSSLVANEVLRRAGWDVHCASTATEAISLLQANRYDMLLVDLNLPDRPGLDVLLAAREHLNKLGKPPRIAIWTAQSSSTDLPQSYSLLSQARIPKPIEPAALVRTIERLAESQPALDMDLAFDTAAVALDALQYADTQATNLT